MGFDTIRQQMEDLKEAIEQGEKLQSQLDNINKLQALSEKVQKTMGKMDDAENALKEGAALTKDMGDVTTLIAEIAKAMGQAAPKIEKKGKNAKRALPNKDTRAYEIMELLKAAKKPMQPEAIADALKTTAGNVRQYMNMFTCFQNVRKQGYRFVGPAKS